MSRSIDRSPDGRVRLCTALFGKVSTEYYGVSARDLFKAQASGSVEHLPCVAAVSVNYLNGLFAPREMFEPLRKRQPLARVGYSI